MVGLCWFCISWCTNGEKVECYNKLIENVGHFDQLQQTADEPVHRPLHRHPAALLLHARRNSVLRKVLPSSFRCTRNMPKFQPFANRLRSDSEEVNTNSPHL